MAKNLKLNDGYEIPCIGLGTFDYKKEGLLENVVKVSLDCGYKLIDCAFIYQTEGEVGNALREKFKDGSVNREDIFIVNKLWNTKHWPKDVIPSIKRSLATMQLDYFDLYLMHWPLASKPAADEFETYGLIEEPDVTIEETWLAMEELVKLGYTKSIGVSNFNRSQIERILKVCNIKPVVNQVEGNPYFNQKKMLEFCKQKDIVVMAYSPFYGFNQMGSESHGLNLFQEPLILELGKKYDKTAGQIVLKFLVQWGLVPIPKSARAERVRENIDIFDFTICESDMKKLESLDKNLRSENFKLAKDYKEYPFNDEY